MMDSVSSSETLICMYQTTRSNIPQDPLFRALRAGYIGYNYLWRLQPIYRKTIAAHLSPFVITS
jgi:hypothetical protein